VKITEKGKCVNVDINNYFIKIKIRMFHQFHLYSIYIHTCTKMLIAKISNDSLNIGRINVVQVL
jgi:hypothetical protein